MRGSVTALVCVTLLGAASPLLAQQPRLGLGIGAGTVLGAQLGEHRFVTRIDDTDVAFVQEIDLQDLVVGSAHAEWYATGHVGLRVHVAWGRGQLAATTYRESDGPAAASDTDDGIGDADLMAIDAGLTFWPFRPGSAGFAPYVTVGGGTVAYDFPGADSFFRAEGTRRQRAWVVGGGADMHIWRTITLRMEASAHMIDSPLRAGDFAELGDGTTSTTDGLAQRVSNMRLTLGAHVYFPFDDSVMRPD